VNQNEKNLFWNRTGIWKRTSHLAIFSRLELPKRPACFKKIKVAKLSGKRDNVLNTPAMSPPAGPQIYRVNWMSFCSPTAGLAVLSRRIILFVPLAVFFPNAAHAQDSADAARQERARKANQQKHNSQHVYTDEDLKRDKILTPEDQARVAARRNQKNAAPGQQNAEASPTDPNQDAESLGEIARRYRQEKAQREAEEAVKRSFAPFPYSVPDSTLAVPRPEIAPLSPPEKPKFFPFSAPRPSLGNSARGRISPFQPRPLLRAPSERVAPMNPPSLRTEHEPPAKPTPPIELPRLHSIEVQRGDSWWKLAQRYLGDGSRWQELRALNSAASEPIEFLRQGSVVLVPGSSVNRTSSKMTIPVKKGDTFWGLARTHFGHGTAWSCLASANPQVSDFTRLAIGSVLQLPTADELASCQASTSKTLTR
jgi:nucleoid-associated protein YgaU